MHTRRLLTGGRLSEFDIQASTPLFWGQISQGTLTAEQSRISEAINIAPQTSNDACPFAFLWQVLAPSSLTLQGKKYEAYIYFRTVFPL